MLTVTARILALSNKFITVTLGSNRRLATLSCQMMIRMKHSWDKMVLNYMVNEEVIEEDKRKNVDASK